MLNGFGYVITSLRVITSVKAKWPTDIVRSYAVDSLVLLLQSIIAPQAYLEIGQDGYARALTISAYAGMLVYDFRSPSKLFASTSLPAYSQRSRPGMKHTISSSC